MECLKHLETFRGLLKPLFVRGERFQHFLLALCLRGGFLGLLQPTLGSLHLFRHQLVHVRLHLLHGPVLELFHALLQRLELLANRLLARQEHVVAPNRFVHLVHVNSSILDELLLWLLIQVVQLHVWLLLGLLDHSSETCGQLVDLLLLSLNRLFLLRVREDVVVGLFLRLVYEVDRFLGALQRGTVQDL